MKSHKIVLFGIPFCDFDSDRTVQECLDILDKAEHARETHHINIVDQNLIGRIYGIFGRSGSLELLEIARKTEITLSSSYLLKWISAGLGSSLTRIADKQELLIKLCRALGEREKGVFLLGGTEKEAKKAAVMLHEVNTGLRIVGIGSQHIYVEGQDLTNARERDRLIIDHINSSNADLLIVNLGSPKQELWFERVRPYIKTPLVFTVRNALNKLVQGTNAPRKLVTEFAHMMNSVVNTMKVGCFAFPLVIYNAINRLVAKFLYQSKSNELFKNSHLFLSSNRTIAVITLPPQIDASNLSQITQLFNESFSHDVLVFDFRNVKHIQPEGFAELFSLIKQRREAQRELYHFSVSSDMITLMKLHRVWDLFKDNMCSSADQLMSRLVGDESSVTFYDTIYQQGNRVVISMFGTLNNTIDYDSYLTKLIPILAFKDCILDLSFCTFIDNTGFSFLLSLRKHLISQGRHLTLCSLSKSLKSQFHEVDLTSLFKIVGNVSDI
jgi:N-acetylglucosaminyldiphosphoundecaprenol N-acetyl-beta-D-mannosaminyltransferase